MSVNNKNNTAHTQLVPVSARTKDSLRMNVQQLYEFLQRMPSQNKEDVSQLQAFAHTLQSGRTALNTRTAFIVTSLIDAQQQFERFLQLFERNDVDGSIAILRNSEIEKHQNQHHETPIKAINEMSVADFEWVKTNWLAGYPISWPLLYQGQKVKRMRLPSHAFAEVNHRSNKSALQPQQTSHDVETMQMFAKPLVLTPQWSLLNEAPCRNLDVNGLEVLLVGAGAHKVDLASLELQQVYAQLLEFEVDDSISNLCDKMDEMVRFDSIVFVPSDVHFDLADTTNTIKAQASGVKYFFRVLKALMRSGFDNESLDLYFLTNNAQAVFDGEVINPTHTGITGLAGVVAKENVNWHVRCIDIAVDTLSEKFSEILSVNSNESGNNLAFRGNHWYQPKLSKLTLPSKVQTPYKQKGVYLVIGGAGSIGFDWTKMIVDKYDAKVIWFGRRQIDERIARKLEYFPCATRPVYMSVDASDIDAFSQAHQHILQEYGPIDGVIHSAMVVKGQNVATLDEQDFEQLLQAKVDVCVNIAKVFANHPTDFLLFFSSINAYTKSLGQSGYAVGCTFKDAFTQALATSRNAYTVNFGYWDSDVINLEETKGLRSWMAREGMATVMPQEAFPIIERFLSSSVNQISLLKVTKEHALREMNVDLNEQKFALLRADTQAIKHHMADLYGKICIDDVHQSEERHFELDSSHTIAQLLATFLAGKLYELNILKTSAVSKVDLVDITNVSSKYHLWVSSSIEFLLDYQFIILTEQGYQLDEHKLVPTDSFWTMWHEHKIQWQSRQNLIAQLQFVELTCRELELVLQDERTASELLFPGASMHLVEEIYKHSNAGQYYNQVVAQAVFNLVAQHIKQNPNAKVNILEVGAGTGATSAEIFTRLQEFEQNIAQYCYTDISKAFLLHAQTHYGPSHDYLDYAIVNLEQPYIESGLRPAHYDIVIATNVIHATSDILAAMNNVKSALKADGTLFINEVCSRSIFTHLTFGLLDGWWLQRDPQLRLSGSPALSVEQWQTVFKRMSFVAHVVTDGVDANAMQSVIAAHNISKLTASSQDVEQPQQEITSQVTLQQAPTPNIIKNEEQTLANSEALEDHIEAIIVTSLETILKVSQQELQVTESFVDYGLDSILGLSFVEKINEQLGITLNPTCIFDFSSVERLTAHILSDYKNQIQWLSEPQFAQENEQSGQLREISNDQPYDATQEIAIIGMSGQACGAKNLDELWTLLSSGTIATGEINTDLVASYGGKSTFFGGVLDNRDKFDSLFFNIAPLEACDMNPHQRLVMQESWSAIEYAGYNPKALALSRTGIYVGAEPVGRSSASVTGGSEAIIASRLSYFLNLSGPALVVNTGCSSSGVAIHLACESLRHNDTDLALAVGVFANWAPSLDSVVGGAGMVSQSGYCKTFDAAADGTILAEGIGVLVLKRLSEAQQDKDIIHAVISASGLNQDGASNGITAPSGQAQEKLICDVYHKFAIDPNLIKYVEAHGTGTSLGDPIEVNALVKAFSHFTKQQSYCAIGSAKPQIGHAAAASGVMGVLKSVLSIRHQMSLKLAGFKTLNPLIELSNSPFYIATEDEPWLPSDTARMIAINSFGHSGTNSHIVVREYLNPSEPERQQEQVNSLYLMPFSAKTVTALLASINNTLKYLNDNPDIVSSHAFLTNFAYTMQTGREAMRERFICVVSDVSQFKDVLMLVLHGDQNLPANCWRETIAYNTQKKKQSELIYQDLDSFENLEKFALAWVRGAMIEWCHFYSDQKPIKLALPTYCFDNEDFPGYGKQESTELEHTFSAHLHPLVQQNVSGFKQVLYRSTFDGSEMFLADHVINGQRVFPGVGYLEMARAAAIMAFGVSNTEICLKDIVWLRPLIIENVCQVDIRLEAQSESIASFSIFSQSVEGEQIHCQGKACLQPIAVPLRIELNSLKATYKKGVLSQQACYEQFSALGIQYGTGYQLLQEVLIGSLGTLSKIRLSEALAYSYQTPAILDACMHGSMGLMSQQQGIGKTATIPFGVKSVRFIQQPQGILWSEIKPVETLIDSDTPTFDAAIYNNEGELCVHIEGWTSRKINSAVVGASQYNAILFNKHLVATLCEQQLHCPYQQQLVILSGYDESAAHLFTQAFADDVQVLHLSHAEYEYTYQDNLIALQRCVQQFKRVDTGFLSLQLIINAQHDAGMTRALGGALKSIRREHDDLICQLVVIQGELNRQVVKDIALCAHEVLDHEVTYIDGIRHVARWQMLASERKELQTPWRNEGVYMITGGAGGLGLVFAKHIANNAPEATIILTGRSELQPAIEAQINELNEQCQAVVYWKMDVANNTDVTTAVSKIVDQYGTLHGVLHAAGVNNDGFFLGKSNAEIERVLSPKVNGVQLLDHATADIALDMFVVFSSTASAMGNSGQVDYAAANGYLDTFVAQRANEVTMQRRFGRSLSVNWPLWEAGGMQVDEVTKKNLEIQAGMVALPDHIGIEAFLEAYYHNAEQVMVIYGDQQKIKSLVVDKTLEKQLAKKRFTLPKMTSEHANARSSTEYEASFEQQKLAAETYLTKLLKEFLRLPEHVIDVDKPFFELGIDSILVVSIITRMEELFGSLSKTLFFEYKTISDLAQYICHHHEGVLNEQLLDKKPVQTLTHKITTEPMVTTPVVECSESQLALNALAQGNTVNHDVAVIGLVGRYAMADDLQQLWENLKEAKDCITEVPKSRWDHTQYYSKQRNTLGKTYTKWGGFLEDIEYFDPLFFNLSPRDSAGIDPQERLFLQSAYHVLEDAGYTASSLAKRGAVGVYVGVMYNEYQMYSIQDGKLPYSLLGSISSIANRVSYFLDLRGPSIAIDTMCSSSLTTIHLACQSIIRDEVVAALAGGVNLSLHPSKYLSLAQNNFASSNGRCQSFGEGGNGYVPSEGVGVTLLKRLDRAITDKDHIYGVIKGSAVNHSGKSAGYTVPDPIAQQQVIEQALRTANVDPRTISYIEAHGTGTELGDPIEVKGLEKVFAGRKNKLAVGAVKSNLGHCESAAGVASVSKVLLQMQYQTLVPSIHSQHLNKNIDFDNSFIEVQQVVSPWSRPQLDLGKGMREYPLRAGISAFGAGGANAHLVIEEAPNWINDSVELQQAFAIVLSAKCSQSLNLRVQQLHQALLSGRYQQSDLPSIAYTLQVGREQMEERVAFVVNTMAELHSELRAYLSDSETAGYRGNVNKNKELVSLFSQDDALKEVLLEWLKTGKLGKLLPIWVKGLELDWQQAYSGDCPRRISLPLYPFAKERYWVPKIEINDTPLEVAPASEELDRMLQGIANGSMSLDEALQKI
ncbi:hypothetical protein PSECIP111951_04006 [Pseudoalteromonas holothuriae]|uniref:Polyketide synthase n=1 Tax=Pseudoalteromonas holothuriae TaxID=2963714 RepID=A0ABM9GNB3_9GAMM|nr:SDR family NAD(P)-dependent oxidoreductase [Pseudoalteromonas sp. CIP111951]CAH9068078.1 hypothetical protein PSECIP111951_04006 [Pseudoalteromonas sp. CIP111951]